MDNECTVYKAVDIIGKKWTVLILLELYKGNLKTRRYSELKKRLPGITPKILSVRLKELENEKLITKKIDATHFPIKCEYTLTPSSSDFVDIIKDIKKWGLKWKVNNKVCKSIDCKKCKL